MSDDLAPVRRGRTALVSASIVGVVMVAFIALLATRDHGDRETASALLGGPAPAIVGETLDGGDFDLDDLRGRWVVVNFFGTWCPPCIVEHPHLVAFHEAHAETGDVEVVSVAFEDTAEDVAAFFDEYGGEWPVLGEGVNSIAIGWGVTGLPESFLVAPNGVVVFKFVGGVTYDDLDSVLSAARGLPEEDLDDEDLLGELPEEVS